MALLGILSLIQVLFLPGYLLLNKVHSLPRTDKLLLSVPISAVANYFLVLALTMLGLFTQQVIVGIFALEMGVLLVLQFAPPQQSITRHVPAPMQSGFVPDFTNILFTLLFLIIATKSLNQFGTVFTWGDAVHSWNPWGISWFNGTVPVGIAWYPQLLPSLYAVTYQFLGDSRIEFFAKLVVSIHPPLVLAIFARMAILLPAKRKTILWSGMLLFMLVRRLWGVDDFLNGYADFPLILFCVSLAYLFVLLWRENSPEINTEHPSRLIYLLAAIAIGAGLTKQSGVYLGMWVPVFYLYFTSDGQTYSGRQLKRAILLGAWIVLGYAHWYLFQYWRISSGVDTSNLKYLSGIIAMPWYASIAYGFKILTYKLSWLWVVLTLAALLHRQVRYLALWVFLPYFLLWAAFVPYDFRNLGPVFPLFALILATGWGQLASLLMRIPGWDNHRSLIQRGLIIAVLTVLAFVLSNAKFNPELLRLSDLAKRQIGEPEINLRLYQYFEDHPSSFLIATPYAEMGKLPGMGSRYAGFSCGHVLGSPLLTVEPVYAELDNPEIHFVLLMNWCDTRVLDHFASHPDIYQKQFQSGEAVFYKILNR